MSDDDLGGKALRGDRYVLIGLLGDGAQGRTFEGFDRMRGQPVAIKRFDVRGAVAWKDVELAEREARVLQSLSHPRLPRYVEHFEEDGALYLVMEKIEGESLAALRARGASLSEDEVMRLLREAGEVLGYLHGRAPPVIHRDLKPGNVIRRPDGSFAFVDFGAVRDKLRHEGGSTVVGTFGYMAPEQFQGRALPASDVYAVGATALAMLTGRQPEDLPHRGLTVDVRAALGPRANAKMVRALEAMLEPDPDRRASRIEDALGGAAGGRRSRAPAMGVPLAAERAAREAEEYARRAQAYAERRARHRSKRLARRMERRERRRQRWRGGVPFPLSIVFALGFAVATVAVTLTTQIVIPAVLMMLSLLFGKPLREAAALTRKGGREGLDEIDRARRWTMGGEPEGAEDAPADAEAGDEPEAGVRVDADTGGPAVRVATDDEEPDEPAGGRHERRPRI